MLSKQTMLPVPKHLLARLLFPNPACVLITANRDTGRALSAEDTIDTRDFNAMCVTWLMPVDNNGSFMMSLNNLRHTVSNLLEGYGDGFFTLSPSVAGMENLLLRLGSCSGRQPAPDDDRKQKSLGPDKIATCGLMLMIPGTTSLQGSDGQATIEADNACQGGQQTKRRKKDGGAGDDRAATRVPAVAGAPAHLVCKVVSVLAAARAPDQPYQATMQAAAASPALAMPPPGVTTDIGHTLFLCKIVSGWVEPGYWHEGKLFGAPPLDDTKPSVDGEGLVPLCPADAASSSSATAPKIGLDAVPPLLCFAGSQRFVTMRLAASCVHE